MPCIVLFLKQWNTFQHGPEGMRNGFLLEMVNKVSQKRDLFRLKAGESRSLISRYWVGWFLLGTGRIHSMPCSQLQLTSAILGFPWFACVLSHFSHVGLCNPKDYSLPGSSVHGRVQERTVEWDAIFLLQGIFLTQGSNPFPVSPALGADFLFAEPSGKPIFIIREIWIKTTRHH